MSIERDFDIAFVAGQALREKQIQQNYRPVIAVHKWFARRPGSLFRGLVLAEFGDRPVSDAFFHANSFRDKKIADPFMGGGTPLLEANRVGCDVLGFDINPMAYWVVRQELASLDPEAYAAEAVRLIAGLRKEIGSLYSTRCGKCGGEAVAKYFLWVKVATCPGCSGDVDLFPGYLVSEDARHPLNVFVCPSCGDLTETKDRKKPGACGSCGTDLGIDPPAKRGKCPCRSCGATVLFPNADAGQPKHRMFAMEYHCHACRPDHTGRFFKRPDTDDLARYAEAEERHGKARKRYIPEDEIPPGDETDRLHHWGYRLYREMFNARQLLGLELSAGAIANVEDRVVREALATNLSDLLRYQNMLCRYDTMALKSLDIFSVHGFPVGLIACESNLLGISNGSGTNVGSGGWSNIVEKYTRAKSYCVRPFEFRHVGKRKEQVFIDGEWIGDRRGKERRSVEISCASSTTAKLKPGSLDAVLTDPPYFGNVQYAELMDFCYVWLRKLANGDHKEFSRASTRNESELTGNATMDRGLGHFTDGLSAVFSRMATAMKDGAPLAFTYHHNKLDAYRPVAVAILDAGLTCTATIPCPAEMGASIHISGTGSSVVDSIFVCRKHGEIPRAQVRADAAGVAASVQDDLEQLRIGGLSPTRGDVRCIAFGHLARLAIWNLRSSWDASLGVDERLKIMGDALATLPSIEEIEAAVAGSEEPDYGPLFRNDGRRRTHERETVSF